jgi:hypothetical protein
MAKAKTKAATKKRITRPASTAAATKKHGGHRKNAGRKEGSATKRTREIADRAISDGVTPLDVMLLVMREEWARGETTNALDAAKAAAPYIHPRLQAIEHTAQNGGALVPKRLEIVFVGEPRDGAAVN